MEAIALSGAKLIMQLGSLVSLEQLDAVYNTLPQVITIVSIG
jgi:hypothetical protein